jgi:hypothetical protein
MRAGPIVIFQVTEVVLAEHNNVVKAFLGAGKIVPPQFPIP